MKKNECKQNKTCENKLQPFTKDKIKKMSRCRIIQRNLLYVQLSPDFIADKSILGKFEYFGQYGKITKIVINKKEENCENSNIKLKETAAFAYITYSKPEEASIALLAADNFQLQGIPLRVFYGTTRYCYNFLKGMDCFNKEMCIYLHSIANEEDIIGVNFQDHQKIAIQTGDIFNPEVKKKIMFSNGKKKTVLPKAKTIYLKENVMQCDPEQTKAVLPINSKHSSISSGNGSTDWSSPSKDPEIDSPTLKLIDNNTKSIKLDNLYHHKSQSRFSFAQSNENSLDNSIPDYIIELIDKKAARFAFFKNIRVQFPLLEYLEIKFDNESIEKGASENQNDSWFEFIKTIGGVK